MDISAEGTESLLSFATAIAKKGGSLIEEAFNAERSDDYGRKSATDPVTDTDHAVEALVFDSIRERFPDHEFIGEESASGTEWTDAPTWIVDPIDGTANWLFFGSCAPHPHVRGEHRVHVRKAAHRGGDLQPAAQGAVHGDAPDAVAAERAAHPRLGRLVAVVGVRGDGGGLGALEGEERLGGGQPAHGARRRRAVRAHAGVVRAQHGERGVRARRPAVRARAVAVGHGGRRAAHPAGRRRGARRRPARRPPPL
ncbi:Inositol monophosphatase [Gracilaria domingensis]|nr:Inositol monophosphatase [Gracilaria domingensis]